MPRSSNSIEPPHTVQTAADAQEILRAWIANGDLHVSLSLALQEPAHWGVALVDIARHVARAYADNGGVSEKAALAAIRKYFDAEWDRPSDLGTTSKMSGH